jgi:uncharacterized membrane protein
LDRLRLLFLASIILILIGFIAVFAALLSEGMAGGGAVLVFIGPFPIGMGFGEYAPVLLLISAIIALAMILIMLMSVRILRMEKGGEEG